MSEEWGFADWANMALFLFLMLVALLAPLVPFLGLWWLCRTRPDLCEAYWQHPVRNALLLSFLLTAARTAFLALLWLCARFSGATIYPAAYAPYPELLILWWLEENGWELVPMPVESFFRFFGVTFGLNFVGWLVFFLVAGGGFWFRGRRFGGV
jgi:hypothetical protein